MACGVREGFSEEVPVLKDEQGGSGEQGRVQQAQEQPERRRGEGMAHREQQAALPR